MKRIIADCFNLGSEKLYAGETLYAAVSECANMIDLDNGVTLSGTGDGRYYNINDENDRYAAVYDWDDTLDQGDLVGYVRV